MQNKKLMHLSTAALTATLWMGCGVPENNPETDTDADTDTDIDTDATLSCEDSNSPAFGCPCSTAQHCGTDFSCYTMAPGGYCMPGAPGGPTACREPESPCPTGSVCSPIPWHQISGVCLLPCDSSSDCRPGYVCDFVELFPGDPSTPRSKEKVCWTVCEPGADQTCNDNPIISSLHGICEDDGPCTCTNGFEKNQETGRCL
ncbi:MAG: hypothetical protein MUC50_22435 [Myxococcota bacterium]|nr:hypothetical protein [Myxococcota bacterium]